MPVLKRLFEHWYNESLHDRFKVAVFPSEITKGEVYYRDKRIQRAWQAYLQGYYAFYYQWDIDK